MRSITPIMCAAITMTSLFCLMADRGRSGIEKTIRADTVQRVTATPSPLTTVVPNPLKGFAAQNTPDEAEQNQLPQSLFYTDITWKELQPQENKVEWEILEEYWKGHFKNGRRVGFRFKMSEPIENKKRSRRTWIFPNG